MRNWPFFVSQLSVPYIKEEKTLSLLATDRMDILKKDYARL